MKNGKNNIILIGMMGSGKTTVGKALANKLRYDFVDLDEIIVQKQGIEIPEIFKKFGEDFFRKLESEIIEDFSTCENRVISTGGGIVKNEQNIINLKKIGKVFYLCAPSNVLYERIRGDINRPLLKTGAEFEQILNDRENAYKKADYTIDATKTVDEITSEIIKIKREV